MRKEQGNQQRPRVRGTRGNVAQRFTNRMSRKLLLLFALITAAFAGLMVRLVLINRNNGEEYERQVLSQQRYDSTTLPYRRGEIQDAGGTVLAYSEKVYNVILDAKGLLYSEDYLEPTLEALRKCFNFDTAQIRRYISDNPTSQYYTLAKQLTWDEISDFRDIQTVGSNTYDPNVKGIWFEENYIRRYPNGSMACDVIGFTTSDNNGLYGLEEYYNDVLSGTTGREYGYLDEDSNLERTTIPATDGNNLVTTIDGNLQSIVEKYLAKFNEDNKNAARFGNGANNVGCIIMDVHNGDVLAMASYPKFDLNDPRNPENLIGMASVDEKGNRRKGDSIFESGIYITEDMLNEMTSEELYQNYNALWRNFCISDTYEPGSVAKPFTVATGLENGCITGNEVYQCNGYLEVGGWDIKCHNVYGDGPVSVGRGIEISCNVAMMKIGQAIGNDIFAKFQSIFGFGLKTNVDLAGESRTEGLTYTAEQMGPTELATGTFGQGFNVDMIEMISAFCSLINGGYFYEPHVVKRITNSSGATVRNIEPRVLRQTISSSTSEKIVEYCNRVVAGEEGTGKKARPAGYMIGGKTGTAQTIPRGNRQYVVSFMGYAPAKDPQIAIYVVIDRLNNYQQDQAAYACRIARNILTEALPYLNIPMTEELSDQERAELEELRKEAVTPLIAEVTGEDGENAENGEGTGEEETAEAAGGGDLTAAEAEAMGTYEAKWKSFSRDPDTGFYVDPKNGNMIDPDTGAVLGGDTLPEQALVAGNGNNASGLWEPQTP
ncbi:MAG: penicillin-binding protein 2 [Butyrivibrio sp.]|nr:penicillin-binding protein 2 [Butyrivibrio sp.]